METKRHTEIPGIGHLPAKHLDDIRDRLDILCRTGCRWWLIEVRDAGGLLETKEVIDAYLEQGVTGSQAWRKTLTPRKNAFYTL